MLKIIALSLAGLGAFILVSIAALWLLISWGFSQADGDDDQ